MYKLDKDVMPLNEYIDQYIRLNELRLKRSNYLLDLTIPKPFTSMDIENVFREHSDSVKEIESLFIDVSLSTILQRTKESDVYDLTKGIVNMIEEVINSRGTPINLDTCVVDNLVIYVKRFIDNVEKAIQGHIFGKWSRLSYVNLKELNGNDKSYNISDFRLLDSNGLYINLAVHASLYERN